MTRAPNIRKLAWGGLITCIRLCGHDRGPRHSQKLSEDDMIDCFVNDFGRNCCMQNSSLKEVFNNSLTGVIKVI